MYSELVNADGCLIPVGEEEDMSKNYSPLKTIRRFYFCSRKCFIFLGFLITFNIIIVLHYDLVRNPFSCESQPNEKPRIKLFNNPPKLLPNEKERLQNLIRDNGTFDLLLSSIVQNQIKVIQSPRNCSGYNILCGHYDECGFACQIHHRAACIMVSYAKSLPLIHNEEEGWPFSKKWSDVFEPLGVNYCVPGPNTYHWNWKDTHSSFQEQENAPCFMKWLKGTKDILIDNPLSEGIVVDKELAEYVDFTQPNPFLWWVGQFMKYTLRLRDSIKDRLVKDKEFIKFNSNCIGIHARRTDKITEAPDSYHNLEEYFSIAEDVLAKVNSKSEKKLDRNLFFASDDSELLPFVQKKFVNWNIMGFPASKTMFNQFERKDSLYEIIRDVFPLADCEYIICGLSSNVCRLLLEMLSFKHVLDSKSRLTSMDGDYFYVLQKHNIKEQKVNNKVFNSSRTQYKRV